MKNTPALIPHYMLVQAFARDQQFSIAIKKPLTAMEAGLPDYNSAVPHPRGHLWTGKSVYATPALGLSHHRKG